MQTRNLIASFYLALSLCTAATAQTSSQPDFAKYPTKVWAGQKVKINLASNKTARTYRTAISDAYRKNKADFSGHYIIATWGCGMGCLAGALIDMKTGKVYDLPWDQAVTDKDELYYNGGFTYHANSRLLIGTIDQDGVQTVHRFLWDEGKKEFKKLTD